MPCTRQKINRKKVEAALNTLCPKCGYIIPPAEIRRYDFNTMKSCMWQTFHTHKIRMIARQFLMCWILVDKSDRIFGGSLRGVLSFVSEKPCGGGFRKLPPIH